MSKSIGLIIASALLVICCAFNTVQALSIFGGMKVFNQQQPQRRFSLLNNIDENVCCFPEKLTVTNQIIQGSINSTTGYQVKMSTVKAYVDLANSRMREDITENGNQMTVFQTQLGSNVITHVVQGNRCTCSKTRSKLEKQCIKKSWQPKQVSVLGEEALQIDSLNGNEAFSMLVLKDSHKRDGICWPLSETSFDSKVSVGSNFYDMVDSVNEAVFWIPSICPPLFKC